MKTMAHRPSPADSGLQSWVYSQQSTANGIRSSVFDPLPPPAAILQPTCRGVVSHADGRSPAVHSLRPGFTLIELLVVMVVAVIIMTVAAPSFISMGRGTGMRTAVNNVRSTVSLARQWAITHREEIRFVTSSTGLVYDMTNGIVSLATNDHACYYAIRADAGGTSLVQRVTDLPLDVTFDSPSVSSTSLTFKTDGGLDGDVTATRTIVLVDKRDPTIKRSISVNGLTGGIKVQ